MPLSQRPQPHGLAVWAAAAAFPIFALAAMPAAADIISVADLSRDKVVTPQQCAAAPQTVFVNTAGRGYCVRYYLSTVGGEGPRPVVFLQGDMPCGPPDLKTLTCSFKPGATDQNTEDLVRYADRMSREQKTTAIYLARVGRDGSSGSHALRHTMIELQIANAALDAIKQRYGFEGFHLYGHSGGANMVGGLAGLRHDVACAVAADGQLAFGKAVSPVPTIRFLDASDMIPAIIRNRALRLIVITDPQDRIVRTDRQNPFVEKLRKAGGAVEQYFVEATDEEHHFTTPHAVVAMADCLQGVPSDRIAADLADYVAKRLAARAAAAAKANANTQAASPVATAGPVAAASTMVVGVAMHDIDLRGSDYTGLKLGSGDAAACQNACRVDTRCAAWTFVRAGIQGEEARCWLKNAVPRQSSSPCCTSGVERPSEALNRRN